jgi:hypothetical protein
LHLDLVGQLEELGAGETVLLGAAVRTAVAAFGVAIVAVFQAGDEAIAAGDLDGRVWSDDDVRLELASGAAAVAGDAIAVVAAFLGLEHIVTALGRFAGLPIVRAAEADFDATAGVAAVARFGVRVVALFVVDYEAIAAASEAGLAGKGTNPTGVHEAVAAAVVRRAIFVVALLALGAKAVAAFFEQATRRPKSITDPT